MNSDIPIINAVLKNNISLVKQYAKNTNIDQQDTTGRTALMWALIIGNLDIAKYLVDIGAKVNIKNTTGHSAMSYAAIDKHIIEYLYACGNLIEKKDLSICNVNENVKDILKKTDKIKKNLPEPLPQFKSILQAGGNYYYYKYYKYKTKYLNIKNHK